jgi:hypothetical protein
MRQYLILTIVSLSLIIAVLLAGIWLHPLAPARHQLSLTHPTGQQPAAEAAQLPAGQAGDEALFTFGEPVDSAILLEIPPSQTGTQPDFMLTTAAIEHKLAKHRYEPSQMICFDEPQAAPLKDPSAFQGLKDASRWEQLIAWMYLSFDRQYQVSLRSSYPQTKAYTLITGQPDHLSENTAPSTVTCEERT